MKGETTITSDNPSLKTGVTNRNGSTILINTPLFSLSKVYLKEIGGYVPFRACGVGLTLGCEEGWCDGLLLGGVFG